MAINWQRPPLAILSAGKDGKAGDRRRGDRWMAWIWNKGRLSRNTQSTSSHLATKHKVKSTTFKSSFIRGICFYRCAILSMPEQKLTFNRGNVCLSTRISSWQPMSRFLIKAPLYSWRPKLEYRASTLNPTCCSSPR